MAYPAGVFQGQTPVTVDDYIITTYGWNITSRQGRYSIPERRGGDLEVAGRSGYVYEANHPVGPGVFAWEISVWAADASGNVPSGGLMAQRTQFETNMRKLMRVFTQRARLSTVRAWQPDGTIRTCLAQFVEVTEPEVAAGGTRATFGVAATIPDVFWEDESLTTQQVTVNANPFTVDLGSFTGMSGWLEDATVAITGPLTNPSVSDAENLTRVERTGTVAAATTWTVDCGASTSKTGSTDNMAITKHYGAAKLLVITNGYGSSETPRLTVTGTGFTSATKLTVSAYKKWISA